MYLNKVIPILKTVATAKLDMIPNRATFGSTNNKEVIFLPSFIKFVTIKQEIYSYLNEFGTDITDPDLV